MDISLANKIHLSYAIIKIIVFFDVFPLVWNQIEYDINTHQNNKYNFSKVIDPHVHAVDNPPLFSANNYSIELKNGSTLLMPKGSWTPELLKISQNISEALALVTGIVNDNPYPEKCDILSQGTVVDFNKCILSRRYSMTSNELPKVIHDPGISIIDYVVMNDNNDEKPYIAKRTRDGDDKDCLINTRKSVRAVPTDCYSNEFHKWYTYKHLDPFINVIFNEWRFTYDFILYDDIFPDAKENQMWYLIAFLKELTKGFPSVDIALKPGDVQIHFQYLEDKIHRLESIVQIQLEKINTLLAAVAG